MCCWLNYDLYKRNAFSDSNSGPLSHICFFFLVAKRDIFCELSLSAKPPLPGLFDGGSESGIPVASSMSFPCFQCSLSSVPFLGWGCWVPMSLLCRTVHFAMSNTPVPPYAKKSEFLIRTFPLRIIKTHTIYLF
ncbi:hypothetical protein HanPSC8_Chr05g0203851 [Helianthus annuus]|nr:hypothetical protein HanPSC8_Chr05g0203851 [Helianthus annuus]